MESGLTFLDQSFWITIGAVFFLLLLSALFSGSETALTAASRGKLRTHADKGSRGAQKALKITEDTEGLIGSVLLGNNLVNILATSLTTALFTQAFGESGIALATLIMTVLVLIFAEVLPKTYAITNAELAAARVAGFIHLIIRVLSPIVASVRFLVRLILRIFGVKTDPNSHILAVREEIAGAIQLGHSEGIVEKEDRDLILGALDLSDRTVEEIMLHRSNIEMIDSSDEPTKILTQCLESVHTRLPLFLNDPDNIVGVIHAKDINEKSPNINNLNNFDIGHVAMEPYFVPDTTSLDDQMRQFLHRRTHFALVVDEYGTLQGLITLEDILEEIVGEISDEFDPKDTNDIRQSNDGSYILEGSTTIRDLNRANDWSLPDDEANTLAGLVMHEAQMIPTVGQVFRFHGYRFEVIERKANRITSIKVTSI